MKHFDPAGIWKSNVNGWMRLQKLSVAR